MKVVNISKRQYNNLQPLELEAGIFNTEAKVLMLSQKVGWRKKDFILKALYHLNDEIFSNKLYTVSELINNSGSIDMEELVLPSSFLSVNSELIGFLVPYIPSINFQTVLDSKEFTVAQKVGYLQEIGKLLADMAKLREYHIPGFYLNDLHENNFILNTQTGKINAVDLDSAKISHNLTFGSRYLTGIDHLSEVNKYKRLQTSIGGVYEVNDNTELYCYMVMIFNFFLGCRISNLSISEYYDYLEYLRNIGVSNELIDIFSTIYMNIDNKNPYEYLEELVPLYGRTHYNTFARVRKKQKSN